jgi:hypothetical protein
MHRIRSDVGWRQVVEIVSVVNEGLGHSSHVVGLGDGPHS